VTPKATTFRYRTTLATRDTLLSASPANTSLPRAWLGRIDTGGGGGSRGGVEERSLLPQQHTEMERNVEAGHTSAQVPRLPSLLQYATASASLRDLHSYLCYDDHHTTTNASLLVFQRCDTAQRAASPMRRRWEGRTRSCDSPTLRARSTETASTASTPTNHKRPTISPTTFAVRTYGAPCPGARWVAM
jgi:hypothetical protein